MGGRDHLEKHAIYSVLESNPMIRETGSWVLTRWTINILIANLLLEEIAVLMHICKTHYVQ